MTFKEIKVKSIDTKSQFLHPSRTIEIKTSEGRVTTPTRAATLYEYNQKIAIPAISPIENPISFSVKKMNMNKLKLFLHQNGLYRDWFRRLIDSDDMMKYSIFRAHVIQPTTSPIILKNKDGTIQKNKDGTTKKISSGVDFLLDNTSLRNRFVRLVLKMQLDAGLDIISIPYLKLPISEYKKFIDNITKEIRNQNKEPLFVFDLDYQKRGDKFEDAMSYFIKNADVKLIAFANKSFPTSAISYDVLSQLVEKDVAFFSFEVMRADNNYNEISKMHYFPFIGNDVYCVKTPRYVPDPNKPMMEASKDAIKFFNPTNLLIEPSGSRLMKPKQILEEMHETDDKWLTSILNNFDKIGKDPDKIAVINAVSKIHELKSSSIEYNEVQKRIKSSESTEYIKEKPILESTLSKLRTKKRKSI